MFADPHHFSTVLDLAEIRAERQARAGRRAAAVADAERTPFVFTPEPTPATDAAAAPAFAVTTEAEHLARMQAALNLRWGVSRGERMGRQLAAFGRRLVQLSGLER
jgi:hypothetical protein